MNASVPPMIGGGAMGQHVRDTDWAATPLGAYATWPQSLRSSLSLVLNAKGIAALYWGPEQWLLYNDAYGAALGDRHPWAFGRPMPEVLTDIASVLGPQVAEVLRTGEGFAIENLPMVMRRHGRDEDTVWTYSFSPIQGEAGSFAGVLLLATEMTAQKRAEEALHDAQAQLREQNDLLQERAETAARERDRVWQFSRDMLGVADDRGIWVSVSPAWTRILGWLSDEIVGRTSEWMEHPDDREKTRSEVASLAAGNLTFEFENRFRTKSGDYRTLTWTAVPDAGQLYCVARDITEERARVAARADAERVQLALAAGAIIGTWFWDLPTDRFTVDEAFARSFGLDPALGREGIPLAQIVATVHPDDQAGLATAINDAIARGGAYAHQYRVRRADERYYWIEANGRVDHDPDGTPLSFPGVLLDVDERRAAQEALRTSEAHWRGLSDLGDRLRDLDTVPTLVQAAAEIMARVTGATRAGYGVVDAARETVEVMPDWCAPGHTSIAGPHSFRNYGSYIENLKRGEVVAVDRVTRDPRTRDMADALLGIGARSLLNVPIVERGQLVGLAFVNYAETHVFTAEDLTFVRAVADRVQTAIARVRAEADQRLLNEEISHRLKNSFAMVLSIAGQTLRTISDRAPVEAFEQRILALSTAHDVLLRKAWIAAPATDVVTAVLASAGHADRIAVSGPAIDLGPRATLSLSLLLHELATNAAKYGALSVPEGRVIVDWRLGEANGDREVTFDWTEQGGPVVVPPATSGRKGFGARLISVGLVGTGDVDLRYPPSGFQATMRASLVQLQRS